MNVSRLKGSTALQALATLPVASCSLVGACVIARNPFEPQDIERYPVTEAASVAALARRHGLDHKQQPIIARVNGGWCLQAKWDDTFVLPGCVVEFHVMPAGGGGNLFRILLTVALIVATTALFGPGGFLVGTLGALGSAAAAAAVLVGGTFLINALLPPVRAVTPSSGLDQPSPTYTLSLQNNAARLGQPIPVLYGRHLIYPDYAATPYVFADTDLQYMRALFVVGHGEYEILADDVRVGTTQISYFPGLLYEVVAPGGSVTIFNPNVYSAPEVTAQTVLGTNETGYDYIGPFPVCAPGTTVNLIDIDVGFPGGLVGFDSGGSAVSAFVELTVEARSIDDDGLPTGVFIAIGGETITATSVTPLHRTFSYGVIPGRYEVRVKRDNAVASTSARTAMTWDAAKGFIVGGPTSFGDVTLLAVQIRLSNSLAPQTSNKFNVIATRKLPIWNGSAWSAPTATRSIAWALADACRNTTYGSGLPDAGVDLAALLELDAIWTARNDTFDAVFDQAITQSEARDVIARVGRAKTYTQSGVIRFFRDQPQVLPVTLFSAASIKLDSFQLEFALPVEGETADGVELQYFDQRIWAQKTITAGVDGATPTNPSTEQLLGIVQAQQAMNEAEYMAAANRYRRVFATFKTELAGLLCAPGDLVLIAHDVPEWGYSGECVSYDATRRILIFAGEFPLNAAYTWSIFLRDQAGQVSSQIQVFPSVVSDRVVLQFDPTYPDGSPFTIETPDDAAPTHFALGRSSQTPKQAIVTKLIPRGEEVEIQTVLEDARVHVN